MTTIGNKDVPIQLERRSSDREHRSSDKERRSSDRESSQTIPNRNPGQIQILEFSSLRESLGDRWEGEKKNVHATVEQVLSSELGPWDFSTPIGPENYLIVFDKDDAGAAKKTSRDINDKVSAILKENSHSTLMDIRPKDGKLYREILSEALSEPAPQDNTTPSPAASKSAHKEKSPAWTEISQPNEANLATEKLDISLDQIRAAQTHRTASYNIGYSPVWNVRQEVLIGYVITPFNTNDHAPTARGHEILGSEASAVDRQDLDLHMLQTQVEIAAELYQNSFTSLLLSQIHFDTLSSGAGRKEVSKITENIPDPLRKLLMVEIVGIPKHTPPATLARRIAGINGTFRALIIRAPSLSFPTSECAAMGATTLSYQISPKLNPASLVSDARKFIASAKAARLLTCFVGVPNVIIAEALKDAGATFVTGNVLDELLEAPENMKPLTFKSVHAAVQSLF